VKERVTLRRKLKDDGFWLGFKKRPNLGANVEDESNFHRGTMECLNSGLDIFLKRSIQTSVVNSHTVS
jgi:hypothetical protein